MPPGPPRSAFRRTLSVRSLLLLAATLLLVTPLWAAAQSLDIIPLDQIQPGMTGVAHTIFAGDEIEKFDLEVIGVLPNLMGPRQSIILVRLKGPKVEHTGVVAGMSGSPVYINGKLAGALSLKFGVFTKEPLAGVTPIQDMLSLPTGEPSLAEQPTAVAANAAHAFSLDEPAPVAMASAAAGTSTPRYSLPNDWSRATGLGPNAYLEPIAAPLVFSGFAPAAIRHYAPEWAAYGMVATPGGTAPPATDDADLVPGAMVTSVLLQGDLSMNAACTVTAVVGDRVYACGHPVFGFGATSMPMARGRVVTTLASDFASTKIVNAGGVVGTVTQDRLTAVMGRIGGAPPMIPVELSVVSPAGERRFQIEMISDRKLTPLLVGVVAFNGLTQNTAYGEGTTLRLSGAIDIAGHERVEIENMYAPTDLFVPDGTFVASTVQQVFTRIFSNPYETPLIERVSLRVESLPERRIARIENAWSDSSEAAPGDPLVVKVLLRPYRGAPVVREVPIRIPPQAARGSTLRIQVSDSDSLNRLTSSFTAQGRLGGLDQLIGLLNRERRNNRVYVTLLNPAPTLLLQDKEMPNAPLSEIYVLNQRRMPGTSALLRESSAGEWSIPMDEVIVGSASVLIRIQ